MRTFGARLALGCVSASFISLYLTVINHLFTITYKTYNRIQCPLPKISKSCEIKDLQGAQKGAYKPAYKKFQKTAETQLLNVPTEVAEIVTVWPELPDYIKASSNEHHKWPKNWSNKSMSILKQFFPKYEGNAKKIKWNRIRSS